MIQKMIQRVPAIIVLAAMVFFTSCGEESDKFLGNWQGTDYKLELEGATLEIEEGGRQIVRSTSYNFKPDGTFIEMVEKYESKGNWKFDAKTKKISLAFTVKTGPTEIMNPVYEVTSVTDTEMKLKNGLNGQGYEYLTFVKK